jgi:predicted RNA-binding Zn-ribbon protein involved in translation (DUF1610 family)
MTNVTNINSTALQRLQKTRQLKKRQLITPVTNYVVLMSPLQVGDDVSLRTMVSSPDLYDLEMMKLIYEHTEFPEATKRPTFDQFLDHFSSYDRKVFLWGLYVTTYKNLPKAKIKCPNCGNQWDEVISCEDILHPDFATFWDKEVPYSQYELPVKIHKGLEGIEDITYFLKIPSLRDYSKILKYIGNEKLKQNYEKFGSLVSKTDNLALITKKIQISYLIDVATSDEITPASEKKSDIGIDVIENSQQIHQAYHDLIETTDVDSLTEKFNNEFEKYDPKFYKPYTCNDCGHNFDYNIFIEPLLFDKFFRIDEQ